LFPNGENTAESGRNGRDREDIVIKHARNENVKFGETEQ
jgi:hypothetical protein